MNYSMNCNITEQAAARLILTDDIDLLSNWSYDQTKRVIDELLKISADELLTVIDSKKCSMTTDVNSRNIPQFGKIETILNVPKVMISENATNIDYVQLGFLLKKDPLASVQSNQKYGENHGKVAAQAGLIGMSEKRFVISPITKVFVNEYSESDKLRIMTRLFVRIPIIRLLLQSSNGRKVNGYDYMIDLTNSTKERRGSSIRAILESERIEDSNSMKERLNNIVWK